MRDMAEGARSRAKEMLGRHGYARGGSMHGDAAQDKALVRKAIREHESAEHKGEHHPLKLKAGGKVGGKHAARRPDRAHRADGGGVDGHKGKHHSGGPKTVNVIVEHGGDDQAKQQMAAQAGMKAGAQAAMAKMATAGGPPHPPMGPPPGGMPPGGPMAGPGGPPPGAMPPGAMPPRPPMAPPGAGGLKRGGSVTVREHERRRAGGGLKC